jgi:hypothetical protein
LSKLDKHARSRFGEISRKRSAHTPHAIIASFAGGLTSKIHALVDGNGLPIRLALTPGEAHHRQGLLERIFSRSGYCEEQFPAATARRCCLSLLKLHESSLLSPIKRCVDASHRRLAPALLLDERLNTHAISVGIQFYNRQQDCSRRVSSELSLKFGDGWSVRRRRRLWADGQSVGR